MSQSSEECPHADADESLLPMTVPIRLGSARPAADDRRLAEATDPDSDLDEPQDSPNARRSTPRVRSCDADGPTLLALPRSGQQIGDYEILEELARGGMGVIYKARQLSLNRIVALKMVLAGDFAQVETLRRFRTEAQAVAQLHHPNLVSIFEIGEHGGLPFYAMEYLEGGPLSRRLEGRLLAARDAVLLMLPLVRAIEYAHSCGIIHRDLKPANILLANATAALGDGIAKITDFGIAKRLGVNSDLTRTGEVLGTPSYMAPEQAAGQDVGPASDVYSLGAILYETLTGQPPFGCSDPAVTLLRIAHEEPLAPRQLNPWIPADLETICLKALEKNPAQRYPSAALLADDLRRFLADEPIWARPATPWDRARKWVKRRPVRATLLAAGLLLAVVGIVALVTFWRQGEARARVEAEMLAAKEKHLVEVQTLLADVLLERGITMAEKHDIRRGLHWMIRSLEVAETVGHRDRRTAALAEAVRSNLAHWGQQAVRADIELPHKDWAWAVDFRPDGRFAVTGCRDGRVRVWDAQTGRMVGTPLAHAGPVWAVRYDPSGDYLFSAGGAQQGDIRAFKAHAGKPGSFEPLGKPLLTPAPVQRLGLARQGGYLFALLRNGSLRLFRVDVRGETAFAPVAELASDGVVGAHFSPDAKTLFFASRSGEVVAFDIDRQTQARAPWQLPNHITATALAADGQRLAVATYDSSTAQAAIHLWDLATAEQHLSALEYTGGIKELAFSPDGRRLAASVVVKDRGEMRGQLRIADLDARCALSELYAPIEHVRPVWALAFHPSGRLLLTGCEDSHSRLFEVATGKLVLPALKHEGNVTSLALSADGRRALSACAGGDGNARARIQELPYAGLAPGLLDVREPLAEVQWHDNGKDLFALDRSRTLLHLEGVSGRVLGTIKGPKPGIEEWFTSPRHLVSFNRTRGGMTLTDLATQRPVLTFTDRPHHPHDARVVQVGGLVPLYDRAKKELTLYRLADGTRHGPSLPLPHAPTNVFAHEGSAIFGAPVFGAPVPVLVNVGADQEIDRCSEIRIWDTELRVRRTWKFPHMVHYASLHPRGHILAVLGPHQFRFFDVATGQPLGKGISHEGNVPCWCLHPTEDILAFGNPKGTVTLWHMPTGKPIGRAVHLGGAPSFLSARPDGSGYLGGTSERRALHWAHLGPRSGSLAELRTWVENLTGMTLDSDDELTPIHPARLNER